MPKTFDPTKTLDQARATIAGAEDRKKNLKAAVDKATERVEKAQASLKVQTDKVAAEDASIARAEAYIAAVGSLNAPDADDSTEGDEPAVPGSVTEDDVAV